MPPSSTLPSTQILSKCWSLRSWKMESKLVSTAVNSEQHSLKPVESHETKQLSIERLVLLPMRNCRSLCQALYESLKAVTYSLDIFCCLSMFFLTCQLPALLLRQAVRFEVSHSCSYARAWTDGLSIKKSSKMKPNSPTPRSFFQHSWINTINHEYPSVSFSHNRFEGADWKVIC